MQNISQKAACWHTKNFDDFKKRLNGSTPTAIDRLHKDAFSKFKELGFPEARSEQWRYTNVSSLAQKPYHLSLKPSSELGFPPECEIFLLKDIANHRLVFVNGHFSESLSHLSKLPEGVTFSPFAGLLSNQSDTGDSAILKQHLAKYAAFSDNAFVALNTSFIGDGAFIKISRDTHLDEPLHVIFISAPTEHAQVSFPRLLIVAESNSNATIIESYASTGDNSNLTAGVTEIQLAEQSCIEHYKLQNESASSAHIGSHFIENSQDSKFSTHLFSFGSDLVRNEINSTLAGTKSHATINGLTIIRGKQHVDNHTVIDHAQPHCTSSELFKGIYADESQGVFSGSIIVRPDAQKTNAFQSNASLLLSEKASVNSQPQLKIWADDVKCSHGATVGELDEEALYYLRSRGIDKDTAKFMLIQAFAHDVLESVENELLREHLKGLLVAKLELDE